MSTDNKLITLEETVSILEQWKDDKVLLLLHINCDIDAYASAVALSTMFKDVQIATPYSVSHPVKRISQDHELKVEELSTSEGFDHVVVLDSSSLVQIKGFDLLKEDVLIIDHHASIGDWEGRPLYSAKETSNAEIVFQILKMLDVELTDEVRSMLIAGVVADTGKFRYATPASFNAISELLEGSNITMDEVFQVLEDESTPDASRTIAVFKGIKRMQYTRVGEHMISTSTIGSFEAAVCRALLLCGSDIAFVQNTKSRNAVRISGRARPAMVRQGFSLAELFSQMGEEFELQGGGHDGAAGLNGRGDGDRMLRIALERAKEFLDGLEK